MRTIKQLKEAGERMIVVISSCKTRGQLLSSTKMYDGYKSQLIGKFGHLDGTLAAYYIGQIVGAYKVKACELKLYANKG